MYHISLLVIHHIKSCIKDLRKSYCVETCLILFHLAFVVFQSLSRVRLCVTPWSALHQASLPFSISQNLLKVMSTEWVMPPNHFILCLLLLFLLSVFPSTRVFSSELAVCIRWSNYWSISFSISPSNEYLGLISVRIDWLDLLAVQGTLKSLLQHHSLKASILWHSPFFMVQLSIHTRLLEKPQLCLYKTLSAK